MQSSQTKAAQIVVEPATRRGSTPSSRKAKNKYELDEYVQSLIEGLAESGELKAVSGRMLSFFEDAQVKLRLVKEAHLDGDCDTIAGLSKSLAGRCADVAANDLLRLCYRMEILAHQQKLKDLGVLVEELSHSLKSTQRLLRTA